VELPGVCGAGLTVWLPAAGGPRPKRSPRRGTQSVGCRSELVAAGPTRGGGTTWAGRPPSTDENSTARGAVARAGATWPSFGLARFPSMRWRPRRGRRQM